MTASWVAIDFETANRNSGSPCAVGMVAVENGVVIDSMSTFIRPPAAHSHFEPFNTRVHGIRSSDVQDAPGWAEALTQIVAFADGRPLVAHNAAFDTRVLREACTAEGLPWPTVTYACSLVVARKTWQQVSHALPACAETIGYQLDDHHEAGADAAASAHVMLAALRHHGVASLDELLQKIQVGFGTISPDGWKGSHSASASSKPAALPGVNPDADPMGPFYGRQVYVTGKLGSMTKAEAMTAIADVGGIPSTKVTKKTNVLVVGTPNPRAFSTGTEKTNNHKKAETMLAEGLDIELIAEADFLERLNS
ncbi:exonuclease domain-containing protein [Streptomyces hirsutus]|uniref:exonuclease domain-containing protein n=1 Tax=Streptomyces hirsutus TaxID=35620 RepID=UPI0033F39858